MKYIVEIKPEYEDSFKGVMILGAKDSNLFVDTLAVENLEELNSDYINEHYGDLQDNAYQRGLEDGKQTAVGAAELREKLEYQRGLNDAWECAKKLFSTMSDTEIEKVFPTEWENGFYGLMQMTPQYAIAKLKAYEKKADDKIEVGDEVTHKSDSVKWTAVVTRISCGTLTLMGNSGAIADNYPIEDFVKTGRHFDIDKILEDMSHD